MFTKSKGILLEEDEVDIRPVKNIEKARKFCGRVQGSIIKPVLFGFEDQDEAYRSSVLPPTVSARVTVEEASPLGWDRYAGSGGVVLAMRSFGMSAPMKVVAEHFGFTPELVAAAARKAMAGKR